MLKIFLKFGKLSRSFFIFVCPLGEKVPHEPRIHDQGPLVPGLSKNTNSVYSNCLHGHVMLKIYRLFTIIF